MATAPRPQPPAETPLPPPAVFEAARALARMLAAQQSRARSDEETGR